MIFEGHNIRTQLSERKNRLLRSSFQSFGAVAKSLFDYLSDTSMVKGIIDEFNLKYPFKEDELFELNEKYQRGLFGELGDDQKMAAFCYQLLQTIAESDDEGYNLHRDYRLMRGKFSESVDSFVEEYFSPFLNYIHDQIDRSNSFLYLLEKFKKRTEWFTRGDLKANYLERTSGYEQVLEDDLRLFLFDQGIEYPFSQPASRSGRVDVVGNVDSEDPIVCEVKVLDRAKTYGINRIKDGITQILRYLEDYGKTNGYLVIFNLDNIYRGFSPLDSPESVIKIQKGNKNVFLVLINCGEYESASRNKTEVEWIRVSDLG